MKEQLLTFIILIVSQLALAQQDPEFTHYMYNMSVINPAYATGDPGTVNLGAFYRSQWVGAVGGPETFSFFGHLPLNKKVETGISFVSDDIGDGALKENNLNADFAYNLQISQTMTLALGLKAGVTFLDTNFNDFRLESGNVITDPAFSQNIHQTYPNLGAGAFLYAENYYLGLSAPNFLNSRHLENPDGIQRLGGEETHVYLTGGYIFHLSNSVELKPAFMIRTVKGVPPMYDLSANVRYLKRFEVGVSYRFDDSVSGLVNFGVTENLNIGYAYDYTTTNLGNYNSGTHEIFLLYNFNLSHGYDKSPRFF